MPSSARDHGSSSSSSGHRDRERRNHNWRRGGNCNSSRGGLSGSGPSGGDGATFYHGNQRIPSLMDMEFEEANEHKTSSTTTVKTEASGDGATSTKTEGAQNHVNETNSSDSPSSTEASSSFFFNPDAASFVPNGLGPPASENSVDSNRNHFFYNQNHNFPPSSHPFDSLNTAKNDKSSMNSKPVEPNPNHFFFRCMKINRNSADSGKPEHRNQRERLIEQLTKEICDCMICVELIRRTQTIWCCSRCFNVFHLKCVSEWALTSLDEFGWRCPGCQSYCEEKPEYRCFCSKMKNPPTVRPGELPHSCSSVCSRKNLCEHDCTLLCHPGPCPECQAITQRKCCCGITSAQVKCSSKLVLTCDNICKKLLNCGAHRCLQKCHKGACEPCAALIQLECYCKTERKEQLCTSSTGGVTAYSCEKNCSKKLTCGHHTCEETCHPGLCKPCPVSPLSVICCPCGQTPIDEACRFCKIPFRKKCTDPLPKTCGKVCRKILPCGKDGLSHTCQTQCHSDKCPPCPLKMDVKCRCTSKTFEINCAQFGTGREYLCEKKCTKKRNCGKHKCQNKCCADRDHICPIVCGRALRCGNHSCNLLCHGHGHCPPCDITSFEELPCECGATVIYPPIRCGTKRPACTQPCSRSHDCDHPIIHSCHSGPTCPPCTFLTEKYCHGKHELRKNVKCHIKELSCGMQCKKPLSCGRHTCVRVCHPGECLPSEGEICRLPCTKLKSCGHDCAAECHDGDCPLTRCKIMCDVKCPCGRKQESLICWKREKEYDLLVCYLKNKEVQRLKEEKEKEKTQDPAAASSSQTEINEESILLKMIENIPKTNVLECDKECARVERNRKMMEALQVEDPDATSTFGTPNYSEYLISFAKKNPQLVENVHDRLTNLVVKAKRSKRKNETYAFECMNRDKRKVVHEYSDHFGIISESFDDEPNRNVVCIASKEKSYLPPVSLIDAVFRPTLTSERKNASKDVEIFHNVKSHIMRPANGKIWGDMRATPTIGTTSSANSSATIRPSSATASRAGTTTRTIVSSIAGDDFPPLS